MKLSVTGRHIEITDSMRRYVEEKANKLTRFYDRVTTIDIVVDQESLQHRVELVVRADHKHTFVAQVDSSDFYKAVDQVADKMERQLTKHKKRVRNRKHPDSRTGLKPEEGER